MMKYSKAVPAALAICAVLGASVAQAATVEKLSGSVRVNKGTGFVAVNGAADVRAGDSVMVDGKGKARVLYSDGCSVPVSAGSLITVGEVSPCSMSAQLNPPPPRESPFFPFLPELGPGGTIAAVGLLGAAGVGLGVGLSGSNNNNGFRFPIQALVPTSP